MLNAAATGAASSANAVKNLAWFNINTKLSDVDTTKDKPNDNTADVPLGGFTLMASGFGHIYFDKGTETPDIKEEARLKTFDDIIVHGGTAP